MIRNAEKNLPSNLTPEGVLKSAEAAVESARGFTNDSLDRAGAAVRDVRASLANNAEHLSAQAQELARRGIAVASRTSANAQKTVQRYANVTGRYVADRPVKSALVAIALGAAVAALVIALRDRDE